MSTMPTATPAQVPPRSRIGKLTPGARAAAKRSEKKAARVSVKQRVSRTGQAAAQAVRDTVATASQGAMQVTGELTELVTEASQNTLAANPLIGLQPRDIASAAKSLLKAIASSRQPASAHLKGYASELAAVIKGESTVAPDPKDRRFVDPAWQSNFLFRRLLQAHMVTQKGLAQVVEESKLDRKEKGRARFFVSLLFDALAPSNWILGNPAALRKILDTGGENLVKGARNLVHDVRHNHMLPSSVDASPFKVGVNVATTPGHVVFRNEMFELLQYTPTTPQVHRRPLVMSPPQVNKYYAVDLTPEKSLIRWAVDSGVQMFVVSWRNPTVEQRHWGLEDYALALDDAVEVARQITGSPDVNMWGSCAGGMTLAAYLGWLAATGQQQKVANTTWAVCVLDTASALEDTTLGLFNTPSAIRMAKARSATKGVITGPQMASMFAWMRPNDLIWNYWVNNYLLGNKPPAFDILAWNADTTRLPGQFHSDLLDLVADNPYVNPGRLEIDEVPIDMSAVKVGAYVIGGITDHITPWNGCYGTARLFGEESTFVLANAGHLQSLLNPPGTPKSFFFSAPARVEDPFEWAKLAQPTRQEGSWWPHWRAWIQQKSGDLVPAPKRAGSRKYRPLEPAPGEYVHQR
jgi:poly[(R)-3-hydroxyalkanoate] polymerase subunit PhaC